MMLAAGKIESGSHIDADLLIIGAGAAGISIARQFAGTAHRVILLESGGEDPDDAIQALYKGAVTGIGTEPLDRSRLRYFGGTTNHWAGWCRPLDPWDFETRPGWPESGWPISRADLDPYYQKAMAVCQLGPYSFDDPLFWLGQPGGSALRAFPVDPDKLRTAMFQISPPTRFAEVYGPDLQKAPNIRIILGATVLELLPPEEADAGSERKHIGSVRAATLAGNSFTVSGRATVLAVGGIETARLLLLSDKIHATGAGNEFDLVGRYFMDHPWIENSAYLQFTTEGQNLPLYFDENELAGTRVFGVLSPSRTLMQRDGIGGFRLWLQPSTTSNLGGDSVRAIVQGLKRGEIAGGLSDHIGNIVSDFDILVDNAYRTISGSKSGLFSRPGEKAKPVKGANIDLNFEQQPNPDSRVSLGQDLDAFGQRRVALDWRFTEIERRTARRAMELAASEFARIGLGRTRIRLNLDSSAEWPSDMIGSRHHLGTARMAGDPRRGVVDADCRVHSMENLFIAGGAVFATAGYANPTLTIVALALRLSDHLRDVLA